MNRKKRKARKMELRRQGLETYTPPWDSTITVPNKDMFPSKIYKHFNGMEIQVGKLKGWEFVRSRSKK